ncbi:DUF5753 domain-containing protein [Amycolatopsis sp. NPDC059021]|uniref:DUF5753 domain-containing protein n=1 Tax=Amycolatopsis sp. NPDC059021 TaxID=3346704 RepID=UPI00366BD094
MEFMEKSATVARRSLTPAALALALGLRAARQERRVGLREMAGQLGLDPASVCTMELGTRNARIENVMRILGFLRVNGEEYRRMVAIARVAAEPNWLEVGPVEYPALLMEYERTASGIVTWAPSVFPDLVQTPEYARAVLDTGMLTGDEIEQGVMIRLVRPDVLCGEKPTACTVLLGDAVLRNRFGGSVVMREQVRRVLDMVEANQVSVRIVPAADDGQASVPDPFAVYEFVDRAPIVGVGQDCLRAYLTEESQVDRYRAAQDRLSARVLGEEDSRALLTDVLTRLG